MSTCPQGAGRAAPGRTGGRGRPDRLPALAVLQRVHAPGVGQLSRLLAALEPTYRDVVRHPDPAVVQVLDPSLLLDEAAAISARFGGTGLLVAETLAAGLRHGRILWFGSERNVGRILRTAADSLGVEIRLAST